MRRSSLVGAVAVIALAGAVAVILTRPASCQDATATGATRDPGDDLLADIELLLFLNRLDLNAGQIKTMVSEARTLQESADGLSAERRRILGEAAADLERKREFLLRDEAVPADVDRRISARLDQLQAAQSSFDQEVRQAGGAVRETLSAAQLALAVGEDETVQHALAVLEGLRQMTPDEFDRDAPPYARELAKDTDVMTADDILALVSQARDLSTEAYGQEKLALARSLAAVWTAAPDAADDVLGRDLLLSPRLIPVLSDKLQTM